MTSRARHRPPTKLVHEWPLSAAVTLGSAVRAKGILLELRARLQPAARNLLHAEAGSLVLRVPQHDQGDYRDVVVAVTDMLVGIEDLPVIPREVEDILSIKSAERHRWLKDGRLQSAGTRTVKLRGRARKITFHVFAPQHIEDVLDRDLPTIWREQDALATAENRRRAAGKAALTRSARREMDAGTRRAGSEPGSRLEGWEEFDLDGLLR